MPRFRPDRGEGTAVVAATLCGMSACRAVGARRWSLNHPAVLAGAGVDVAKPTPADTSLWLLRQNGENGSQHLRSDADGKSPGGAFVASAPTLYGYWYLEGSMPDSAGRRICFLNHTGRTTGRCLVFSLDTVPTAAGPRRRLQVQGYRGTHTTSTRVLLARDP